MSIVRINLRHMASGDVWFSGMLHRPSVAVPSDLWVYLERGPTQLVRLSKPGAAQPFSSFTPAEARLLGRLLMTGAYFAKHGQLPPWAGAEGEEIVKE